MESSHPLEAVLVRLEWAHLDPGRGNVPPELLIAPEFAEVGAWGRRIDREEALRIVRQRAGGDVGVAWQVRAVRVIQIDARVYLLTYDLHAMET